MGAAVLVVHDHAEQMGEGHLLGVQMQGSLGASLERVAGVGRQAREERRERRIVGGQRHGVDSALGKAARKARARSRKLG